MANRYSELNPAGLPHAPQVEPRGSEGAGGSLRTCMSEASVARLARANAGSSSCGRLAATVARLHDDVSWLRQACLTNELACAGAPCSSVSRGTYNQLCSW